MGFPGNLVRAACLGLVSGVLLTGCGACGDVKRIDLKTVPPAQLTADMALFGNPSAINTGLVTEFTIDRLAKHPDAAQVFIQLGYVKRQDHHLVFTPRGLAASYDLKYLRGFHLEESHRAGPVRFTYETEEVVCNEGNEFFRTYGYDYWVGPLTPLGRALLRRGLLYRGDVEAERFESPVRWKGPAEPLHETFQFDPTIESGKLVRNDGGESLGFTWARPFAGD